MAEVMTLGCSSHTTYTEVKGVATAEEAAVVLAAAMEAEEAGGEGAGLVLLRLPKAFPKVHTNPSSNLRTQSGCKTHMDRKLGEESEKAPPLAY